VVVVGVYYVHPPTRANGVSGFEVEEQEEGRGILERELRELLRHEVSRIQREREYRVRRMHIITTYGTKLFLGGGSRPLEEQIRSGYPEYSNKGPDYFRS
jgi:hypothetical protein